MALGQAQTNGQLYTVKAKKIETEKIEKKKSSQTLKEDPVMENDSVSYSTENRCVCCGCSIPEGMMVCRACEGGDEDKKETSSLQALWSMIVADNAKKKQENTEDQ